MIQTYHLLDGGQITASSPEEFVRLLREGSRFDYDCTDQSIWRTLPGVTGSCMACQLPPIPLNIS